MTGGGILPIVSMVIHGFMWGGIRVIATELYNAIDQSKLVHTYAVISSGVHHVTSTLRAATTAVATPVQYALQWWHGSTDTPPLPDSSSIWNSVQAFKDKYDYAMNHTDAMMESFTGNYYEPLCMAWRYVTSLTSMASSSPVAFVVVMTTGALVFSIPGKGEKIIKIIDYTEDAFARVMSRAGGAARTVRLPPDLVHNMAELSELRERRTDLGTFDMDVT